MFLKLLIITLVLIAIAFLGFALQILMKKNGKFPEIHVGHNKEMKKRKIYCAKIIDKLEYNNTSNICDLKKFPECNGCQKK